MDQNSVNFMNKGVIAMPLSFYKLVSKHEHKLVYRGSLYMQLNAPLKRQEALIIRTPRKEIKRRLG